MSKKIFLPLPSFLEFLCFSRVLAGTSWHGAFKPFVSYYVVNMRYFNYLAER